MARCRVHEESCVLCCKQCDVFICARCVDSDAHKRHEFCIVEKGLATLTEQSIACAERLRDLRNVAARSRAPAALVRGGDDANETARLEQDLLELFRAVESAIATLKLECITKLWSQKQQKETHSQTKGAQLRDIDRTLHALQAALAKKEIDVCDLEKSWMDASALIERIEAKVAEEVSSIWKAS